ncbi:GNAT family N-acetyltransferase [Spartinivicinus marinus]|uniref:GNAT family N-acetyltransferase n=1 Tax=Spartinivicinus marinus TaxID=2994442 RepID=UPI001C5C8318|nr:GNAT family protein [Spartinivicinus marinus]MCX4026386.1 GNAT family protein [Spartinivicinus marinus]
MIVETDQLVLRDFQQADIEQYCVLTQDEKYQRFYSEEDCSIEKARTLAEMFVKQTADLERTKFQLAVTLKDSGQLLGTVGLRLEPEQQASIGCGIARKHQATGHAKAAMSALIGYGFKCHNLHRIYAETIADNKSAIQLCKKLGMREEAYFVENRFFKGKWWNTVVMAILKREWQKTK